MSKKLLLSLAPLIAVVAFVVAPTAAQANSPHYYVNNVRVGDPAFERVAGEKVPVLAYGHLSLTPEGATIPTECENAVSGYLENPAPGGVAAPAGAGVTEAFDAFNCHNTECTEHGGKIGVIFENEGALGRTLQIKWPSILEEKVAGKPRIKSTGVAVYVHCQFAYAAPTEKLITEGPLKGTEERNTPEFNGGTKVTCQTIPGKGLQQPLTRSGKTLAVPSETEFDSEAGKLECGLFKGTTAGILYSEAYSEESGVPGIIATKKE
jgi:hypothetical protein